MTTQTDTQPQPDKWARFGRTMGRLLGFGLRLMFVILLALALGAGVYYGIPWVYRNAIEPVQNNTAELTILKNRVEHLDGSTAQAQAAQDARLTALETSGDSMRERTASAETAVSQLESTLQAETSAREALQAEVTTLTAENESLTAAQSSLAAETAKLQDTVTALREALAAANTDLSALQTQQKTERVLLRVKNDLLLARLQLSSENKGQARTLLAQSSADLGALVEGAGSLSADERLALSSRLALADGLLDPDPALALDELDGVWAQLDRLLTPAEAGRAP